MIEYKKGGDEVEIKNIPNDVKETLLALENNGFEAYLVGGCVRDMLMKRTVHDYDITTDALPDEVIEVFDGSGLVTDGIRHGTVGIIKKTGVLEITTYRIDGRYSDSRHPDGVRFTKSLREDLSRRDFTVNAIACDIRGNIADPFGGISDIGKRVIRAVGDPRLRFSEDALRIIRAIRFSSVLGFDIENETLSAMLEKKELLKNISPERIYSELTKLLTGKNAGSVLKYWDILPFGIKPDALPFEKRTQQEAADFPLSYALFLKNDKEKAEGFFASLRADKKTAALTTETLNTPLPDTEVKMRLCLSDTSRESIERVISYKYLTGEISSREPYLSLLSSALKKCFKTANLAVNGNDLKDIGFSGRGIGEALSFLLREVIENGCENEKESLILALKSKFTHN